MSQRDDTVACTAGIDSDRAHGAIMPPIYLSANFSFAGFAEKREFDYTRSGNPTRSMLADALAKLEGGEGAVITSSGMAAVDVVLSLLDPGALIVAPHDCYGGTWRLFEARAKKGAIRTVYVDQNDPVAVGKALARGPALFWIETPSNPLMRIVDVAGLAAQAKAVGAKVAVDNTFLSPALQKPIVLGADFSVHSTTKYINGHSDVVGGAVAAASRADADQLIWWANCCGTSGSPFDSWLTLRGLRTLGVRIERQQASAGRIAEVLARHKAVKTVYYPGLPSHPNHVLARRQQRGFGAMVSFELNDATDAPKLVTGFKRFCVAESLGGVESLVAHPATMTHAAMSAEARAIAGIGEGLFRLSVGLEHVDDLIVDLEAALSALD